MKLTLRKIYWMLSQQIGIDLRLLIRLPYGLVRYGRDLLQYRTADATARIRLMPCLHDWWEPAGAIENEYFWQDLLVARMVHQAAPERHVDVGSRLDGFVAHLAAFRKVEVFDIRPLEWQIPNVTFTQADMVHSTNIPHHYADSVSCLHAIEHFGLGRYGDPINPNGVALGFANLVRLLRPGGTLYLTCPLGNDVVHFNAHRGVHPGTLLALAGHHGLSTVGIWYFDPQARGFVDGQADEDSLQKIVDEKRATLTLLRLRKPTVDQTL